MLTYYMFYFVHFPNGRRDSGNSHNKHETALCASAHTFQRCSSRLSRLVILAVVACPILAAEAQQHFILVLALRHNYNLLRVGRTTRCSSSNLDFAYCVHFTGLTPSEVLPLLLCEPPTHGALCRRPVGCSTRSRVNSIRLSSSVCVCACGCAFSVSPSIYSSACGKNNPRDTSTNTIVQPQSRAKVLHSPQAPVAQHKCAYAFDHCAIQQRKHQHHPEPKRHRHQQHQLRRTDSDAHSHRERKKT